MIWIVLALAVLVLPLQWLFAILLAAFFHELCHYAAVKACGGQVLRLEIGWSGAQMEVAGLSTGKELLCSLAGPAGGLALLMVIRWIPRTAICAGFQSLFNLIPVYPLDGGRALRCGLELIFPLDTVDRVCLWVRKLCLIFMVGLGLYGTVFLHLGLMPLLLAVVLCGKIACKPSHH